MKNVAAATRKMIGFYHGNRHDIAHFLKVWAMAKTIGELEGLDGHTQEVLELAAVVHDIACPLCREKYGDTNGKLVDWEKVFGMIDSLYSGFYSKLHRKYGDLLSSKEQQIIVLMVAGFSTKEISVITGQTPATIYVRKSSIRKKLGVPEKEDIVAFLKTRDKD